MKKIVGLIGIAAVLFMLRLSVFAGDIVTPLMSEDGAQVYFGKIKNVTDESVTVIQNKNIKGEFERDREYTYERLDSITREPIETGDIYLCRKGDSLSQHPSERESFKPSLPRNVTFPKEKVGGVVRILFINALKNLTSKREFTDILRGKQYQFGYPKSFLSNEATINAAKKKNPYRVLF